MYLSIKKKEYIIKKEVIEFYKSNFKIVFSNLLITIAIWTYSSLFNMILQKYYNFSSSILSFASTFFVIGFFIGVFYTNIKLENRIIFLNFLLKNLLSLFLLNLFFFFIIFFNLNHIFILPERFLEGIISGSIAVLFNHIFKSLIRNKQHVLVTHIFSIKTTLIYILKALVPIIISFIILHLFNFPAGIYLFGSFFYLISLLYILKHKMFLYFKTQRLIIKTIDKLEISKKQSLKNLLLFFKEKKFKKDKYFLLFFVSLRNVLRPFYDLYIMLYFINYYNFSILKISSMLMFMVLGQASQIIVSYIREKISLYSFLNLGLFIYLIPFIFIIKFPLLFESNIFAGIVFYLLGIGRNFQDIFELHLNLSLIKKGIKINQIEFAKLSTSETAHYFSYLFFALLLFFGLSIHDLFYFSYFFMFLLFLTFLFYKINFLNSK